MRVFTISSTTSRLVWEVAYAFGNGVHRRREGRGGGILMEQVLPKLALIRKQRSAIEKAPRGMCPSDRDWPAMAAGHFDTNMLKSYCIMLILDFKKVYLRSIMHFIGDLQKGLSRVSELDRRVQLKSVYHIDILMIA